MKKFLKSFSFVLPVLFLLSAQAANAATVTVTLNKSGAIGYTDSPNDPGGAAGFTIECPLNAPCTLPGYRDIAFPMSGTESWSRFVGWCYTPGGCPVITFTYTFTEPTTMYARPSGCFTSTSCTFGGDVGGQPGINGTGGTATCTVSLVNNNCVFNAVCNPGFYGLVNPGYGYVSPSCSSCTNKPANAVFTGPGVTGNDCPWACSPGYSLTGPNTCTPSLCAAGATKLRVGNLTIPLYSAKLTTPSINIRMAGGVCYVSLAAGHSAGALNINYGGVIYHSVQ